MIFFPVNVLTFWDSRHYEEKKRQTHYTSRQHPKSQTAFLGCFPFFLKKKMLKAKLITFTVEHPSFFFFFYTTSKRRRLSPVFSLNDFRKKYFQDVGKPPEFERKIALCGKGEEKLLLYEFDNSVNNFFENRRVLSFFLCLLSPPPLFSPRSRSRSLSIPSFLLFL